MTPRAKGQTTAPATPSAQAASNEPTGGDSPEPAEPSDAGKRPKSSLVARPSSIAIVKEPAGRQCLTVHYYWPIHKNASVEVRLVPGAKDPKAGVSPIYFCDQLQGKVREAFFQLLDKSNEGGGKKHSFTKERVTYTMVGKRNSLGRQAVYVQTARESGAPEQQPAMAYLQLDTWAVDPSMGVRAINTCA